MPSKSSSYYKNPKNKKALAKKKKYDREYRKREKGSLASGPKKKRLKKADAERWAERKKRGIAGKDGKSGTKGRDVSHTKSGKTVLEARSSNRSRNGKDGKSTRK
tara:strand:- start:605 stop:919 length:315 start_codon:yes stop_codon:yes gene_type:complete